MFISEKSEKYERKTKHFFLMKKSKNRIKSGL